MTKVKQLILWGSISSVSIFFPFPLKPQMWFVGDQRFFRICRLGILNVCTKYFTNPCSRCFKIYLNNWKLWPADGTSHQDPSAGHHQQLLTPWWCQRKNQGITTVIRIHPLCTMNVCAKCHGNPSSSGLTGWPCHPLSHAASMSENSRNPTIKVQISHIGLAGVDL